MEAEVGKSRKLLKRAAVLAALTALCAVSASPTQAQDYPTRPIRVLIAFPPGGPTDFVGRLIADKMSTLLGQRVYIENKPGANGTFCADNIAKADPDGYSLFLTTAGAVTISPHIIANIPYDSLRDFAPIAEVVTNTTVLVVSPKMAIKKRRSWWRWPNKNPARSRSLRRASARPRISPRYSLPMPRAPASSMCLIGAPRRC